MTGWAVGFILAVLAGFGFNDLLAWIRPKQKSDVEAWKIEVRRLVALVGEYGFDLGRDRATQYAKRNAVLEASKAETLRHIFSILGE